MYDLVKRSNNGFLNMFDDVDSVFESLHNDFYNMFGNICYENENGDYIVEIEVPGFDKSNLTVDFCEGTLTVKGKRDVGNKRHAGKSEIHKRMIIGNAESVDAKVKDGILYLIFKRPKKESREVEVK